LNKILPANINNQTLRNILLFAAGVFAFAYFIHSPGWTVLLAWAGLALTCIALYHHILNGENPRDIFQFNNSRYFSITITAGLLLGAGFGMYYRINIGASPLPASITWFAPVAIVIGLTEEFVFRGVAFNLVKNWSPYIMIPVTALLHASYKTIIFLQPHIVHPVDTHFLFYTTFIAGLVLGFLRYAGRSVFTPMVAHGTWDLWVYGDSPIAPWWVW
jgi:membrane protease YdiL (CAAX protease family)